MTHFSQFFVHFLYFLKKLYHILRQKRFYDASEHTISPPLHLFHCWLRVIFSMSKSLIKLANYFLTFRLVKSSGYYYLWDQISLIRALSLPYQLSLFPVLFEFQDIVFMAQNSSFLKL